MALSAFIEAGATRAILSLVARGGMVRSFHVDGTAAAQLVPILRATSPRRRP